MVLDKIRVDGKGGILQRSDSCTHSDESRHLATHARQSYYSTDSEHIGIQPRSAPAPFPATVQIRVPCEGPTIRGINVCISSCRENVESRSFSFQTLGDQHIVLFSIRVESLMLDRSRGTLVSLGESKL